MGLFLSHRRDVTAQFEFHNTAPNPNILLLSCQKDRTRKELSLSGIQTKRTLLDLRYLEQLCNQFLLYVLPKLLFLMLCCLPGFIPFHYQSFFFFCPVFYLPSYIFSSPYFISLSLSLSCLPLFLPLIHLSFPSFLLHFSFRLVCCRESRTCLPYS